MDSGGKSASFSSIPDWDWEPTDQESIDAIEAAFSLAESVSAKRRRPNHHPVRRSSGRRLPNWGNSPPPRAPAAGSPSSPIAKRINESTLFSDAAAARSSCPRNGNSSFVPSPCQFNMKARYPLMNFGGRIVYSRTFSEVEKAAKELWEMVQVKKQSMEQISLGLDIEWRPTFRRGEAPKKAAVMQICASTDHCYVMHIFHSGIPPILQSLLEDSTSIKVGVCIANDASKIMMDYNVGIKELEDLSDLANVKLGGFPKKWGLASLVETLTCKQLAKPGKIRMGNWETNVLSKEQLRYAATDAFASWYLYQVLRSFPDAAETQGVDEKVNSAQS
ncbi:hypothetical protein MRB53_036159 [Persea americana]|uniref:Uncharacterized protein n=1 Tax=Persea americana TaxID=3435 RepID=A0ACC2K719_PERAE|nr:hypothetical protein MRB53_036159 [Persea americana]|eukprot:TRINITY_DN8873_c0_g1_i5.p1 TRINITY_DN8873_c0_g1~~TRINITY_DN8873_c0_g1_i5.p1  ORF type:complete len:333 (+),score=68.89 TRINITY_DN8873_c0_g1_i5:124-1122(+)